jgi:lysozyme family protein
MAELSPALAFTLKNEGGYTDDPHDHGGPTNFGLTIADLSAWKRRRATADDIKNLSMPDVEKIYRAFYWEPLRLDLVNDQSIATALFDTGVLNGTATACKLAQAICGLEPDGHMGPHTIGALNSVRRLDFLRSLQHLIQGRYTSIVQRNPSQGVFLKGWQARAARLLTLA